jgi:hypothetical protein
MGNRFLCKKCRNVFDLTISNDSSLEPVLVCCTHCGGFDVTEAPAWAPLGSGMNIYDDEDWEYECQDCKYTFKMPIPQSQNENEKRTCPICKSGHLHRIYNRECLPLYCG